jgi:serine/threonine protein phosphatase PrpC/Leucine-rich repeat (LRR) protein
MKDKGFPVSQSFLLTKVPPGLTKEDIAAAFPDSPIEAIVLHWISDNLFANAATVVFSSMDVATRIAKQFTGKKVPPHGFKVFPAVRPNDLSISQSPGELRYQPQRDDVPSSVNRFAKNYVVRDWKDLSEIPEIPPATVYLSLRFNLLRDFSIPLANVTTIDLSGNSLTSFISLTDFPQLQLLNISRNLLSHLPEFSDSIVSVIASNNLIVDVPESIATAVSLRELEISDNSISELPVFPTSLRSLMASNNAIKQIADSPKLPELDTVLLDSNCLVGVPAFLNGHLRTSSLSINRLRSIDFSFFVEKLTAIHLPRNEIESLSPEFFKSNFLTTLILYGNRIQTLPAEFSRSALLLLDLSENPITSLPEIPIGLTTLKLNFCGISDLSPIIPARNHLRSLHAIGNGLTKLPTLPEIEELIVCGNDLTECPAFNCFGFATLTVDVSCNKLAELPEIAATFRLFDVSHNSISQIPTGLFDSTSRICLTDNPIEQVLDVAVVEAVDTVGTKITVESPGKRVQEIVRNWEGAESSNPRDLYLEIDENVGYAEMIGARPTMEDAIIVRRNFRPGVDFFAVFDGHCGHSAARYAAAAFPALFKGIEITVESVRTVFDRFHSQLISLNDMSGCTVDLVFLEKTKVTIVHLGDGKVVIYDREGVPKFQTEEHIPILRRELERLRDEKVTVARKRTSGVMAMSKSLGDAEIKGMSQVPDFDVIELSESDGWIVIGCDGIWDDLDPVSAGKTLLRARSTKEAARLLRDQAYGRGSDDNISVIVIKL